MASTAIDYEALAKQAGAISSSPAMVDYAALAKRAGAISSSSAGVPDAGAQMRSSALRGVTEHMQLDNPYNFTETSGGGFLESAKEAFMGPLRGLVHLPTAAEISPTGGAEAMKDIPAQAVQRVSDQALAGTQPGAAGTALGTGAGLAAPLVAGEALRLAGPAVSRATTTARTSGADLLRASAEKNIDTAINPTTRVNKALVRDKIAPGLVDRRITASSLKDLQDQAQAQMEVHGAKIDDIFDQHAEAGTKLSPKPILEALEKEKQNYIVDGEPVNPAYVNRLQGFQDQLQRISDANGGKIPLASLRRVRQANDEIVAQSKGGFALPPDAQSAVNAAKTYSNAIRSTFAENVDGLADANREFNFWSDTDKVVDASLLRKTGQRAPLTQKFGAMIGGGIGAAVGHTIGGKKDTGAGVAAGSALGSKLGALSNSTIWNTLSANLKARVASRLAAGDEAGAIALLPPPARAIVRDAATVAESKGVPLNAGSTAAGESAALPEAVRGSEAVVARTPGDTGSASTTVSVPGQAGRGYQAEYKVRELADLNASHNGQTFAPNAEYKLTNDRDYGNASKQGKVVQWSSRTEFDPRYHITDNPDATNGPLVIDPAGNVLGGNGRKMILDRVYASNPKGAQAYRNLLKAKAGQFGVDPAAVDAMKQPVLVREIPEAEFRKQGASKQFGVTDFNKSGTASLTPGERAIADSRRVSPATLDDVAGRLDQKGANATLADILQGKPGGEVLNKLIGDGVLTPQERAAFMTSEGELTPAGKDRVQKLILGRFFEDPAQLDSIAPSVRNNVERIAAPLAQVEAKGGERNLTPDVQSALRNLERAQKLKIRNVDDYLRQEGLFGAQNYAPRAIALAKALQSMGAEEIKAAARQYAGDAAHAAGGESLFGNAPTPASSFADAFERAAAPVPAAKNALSKPAKPKNSLTRK